MKNHILIVFLLINGVNALSQNTHIYNSYNVKNPNVLYGYYYNKIIFKGIKHNDPIVLTDTNLDYKLSQNGGVFLRCKPDDTAVTVHYLVDDRICSFTFKVTRDIPLPTLTLANISHEGLGIIADIQHIDSVMFHFTFIDHANNSLPRFTVLAYNVKIKEGNEIVFNEFTCGNQFTEAFRTKF